MALRFVLNRPRNSSNIGAAARALANTSAGSLWVVEPVGYDRVQAARLAAGADEVLEQMQTTRSLDEALGDCVEVIMTTGREVPGALDPEETAARLLAAPGHAALVFGDEVHGLTNQHLRRAMAVATIPTGAKSSLNLAQAVLVFGYEVLKARGVVPAPPAPIEPLADERLIARLRERAREILLPTGFLNPQQPDVVLDELFRVLRRARPSRREVELSLAACDQLARCLAKPPR